MPAIIAVMSGKGGVGKSSIAAMLAKIVSEKNKTVILDFDICGPSITTAFGVEGTLIKTERGFRPLQAAPNLDVLSFGSILKPSDTVIWRGPKKQMFLNQFYNSIDGYDYVVIDTPPGISEEHAFLVDKNVRALIVTTPQNIALNDAQRCIEFCIANNIQITGVVENMGWFKCAQCPAIHHPFGSRGGKLLSAEYNIAFMESLGIEPEWAALLDTGTFSEKYRELHAYSVLRDALKRQGLI